jgi:hypothetical protein
MLLSQHELIAIRKNGEECECQQEIMNSPQGEKESKESENHRG